LLGLLLQVAIAPDERQCLCFGFDAGAERAWLKLGNGSPKLFSKNSTAIQKISVQKIFASRSILELVQIGS
jgi:hypothetical protein